MRTVAAAFTAVSRGAFDELGELLSAEVDWHGLPDADGLAAHCHGHEQALAARRSGLPAGRQISVSAFVEEGDRVLARVHPTDDNAESAERFMVAEVHDGQITHLSAYATELEAHAALRPPDDPIAG